MNKQRTALPNPVYPPAERYGCEICRNAFTLDHVEACSIPSCFAPVQKRAFYACSVCEAIWALTFNRKDRMYDQTPVPEGMVNALRAEATLDDLMVPLFSWPPIIALTEEALWDLDYEPQELWDRLVAAWRDPKVEPVQQSDILRMLARLVRPKNPRHRQCLVHRGWLLNDPRGFENDLDTLEHRINSKDSDWWSNRTAGPKFPEAQANLQALKHALAHGGVVLGRELQADKVDRAASASPAQPLGEALSGREPLDEEDLEDWYGLQPSIYRRMLELLLPYWSFMPSVLIGWVLVEYIGGAAGEPERLMLQGFFLAVVQVFTGAGVAANAGISCHGAWQIGWRRMSMIGEYLIIGVLWFVMMFAYLLAISAFTPTPDQSLLVFGALACLLLLMARLWPFWIIQFMQPIENDEVVGGHKMGYVRRSALGTAWKLTRNWRTYLFPTTLWLVATGVSLTVFGLCVLWWGDWVRILLLYPVVLPVLYAFTWALVEPLPDSAGRRR